MAFHPVRGLKEPCVFRQSILQLSFHLLAMGEGSSQLLLCSPGTLLSVACLDLTCFALMELLDGSQGEPELQFIVHGCSIQLR